MASENVLAEIEIISPRHDVIEQVFDLIESYNLDEVQ